MARAKVFLVGAAAVLAVGMVAILSIHASAPQAVLEDEADPWTFQPTKFGPLRRKFAQSSRYEVLALWRATEHALETCMQAVRTIIPVLVFRPAELGVQLHRSKPGDVRRCPSRRWWARAGSALTLPRLGLQEATIFPELNDHDCYEVTRAVNMVHECMRHQRDGFQGRASSKNGAWGAMPQLVELTNALSDDDRDMVEDKLNGSPVLYTLTRLEGLHARCHGAPRAVVPHSAGNARGVADVVQRAGEVLDYARENGGLVREPRLPAAGLWAQPRVALGLDREAPPARRAVGNDALRRALRRGYLNVPAADE